MKWFEEEGWVFALMRILFFWAAPFRECTAPIWRSLQIAWKVFGNSTNWLTSPKREVLVPDYYWPLVLVLLTDLQEVQAICGKHGKRREHHFCAVSLSFSASRCTSRKWTTHRWGIFNFFGMSITCLGWHRPNIFGANFCGWVEIFSERLREILHILLLQLKLCFFHGLHM